MGLKAKTDQGKTVMWPQFAARCRFLLSGKWLRKSFPRRDLGGTPRLKGPVPPPSLIVTVSGAPCTSSASRPSKDGRSTERDASSSGTMKEAVRDIRSWVRGQWIPFDVDALSQFLGDLLVLEEGQECEFSQRRNRADGFDEEAIAQLLCTPGQDFARTAAGRQLVYTILTRMSVHVAQLIANAIYLFAGMPPTRHPLDPDKSNRDLGFPALITGLCQSFGVPVTPSKVIRPPITRAFIEKYCTPRQAQGDAPQDADAPPPPHQADPAGSLGIEHYLQHLVRQQAANHRGQVQIHECLYRFNLSQQGQGFALFACPTPEQFRAEVAWPGDWP
ncbi:hypothetical protein HKD37_08G022760 [Glycine soja]